MKQLNVPLILQEHGSIDCGPTSVQMVLQYFDIQKSLPQLQAKLHYDPKIGTSLFDNGSLFLDEGFQTTVVTAQPLLFPPDIQKTITNEKDIETLVENKLEENTKQKHILKTFLIYLKKVGKVKLEIPAFTHIKKAIDDNMPVIALLNAQSLGSNEGEWHFVVVTGYNDNEVFLNNPWPLSRKQGWFPFEQFIYGVHASTCVAIDNGTFLIASKD